MRSPSWWPAPPATKTRRSAHALGPIFRTVFWHSIAGAAVVGTIAMLQAYVFTGAIPALPIGK